MKGCEAYKMLCRGGTQVWACGLLKPLAMLTT